MAARTVLLRMKFSALSTVEFDPCRAPFMSAKRLSKYSFMLTPVDTFNFPKTSSNASCVLSEAFGAIYPSTFCSVFAASAYP